jgi:hypothetical protein
VSALQFGVSRFRISDDADRWDLDERLEIVDQSWQFGMNPILNFT